MLLDRKIIVVMPAYNAEKTLERTYLEIPRDIVDEVVLVDDRSSDDTTELAARLGIRHILRHESNLGYGGNQKTCYRKALDLGADIIIMVHPDYQYTPKLIPSMAWLIANGLYDVVLGSRILGKDALKGGMPWYKYVANRFLTLLQNLMLGEKLTEYHTGYRAYSRRVLESIDFSNNSNGFIFDNEALVQILGSGFRIGEISCPTKYFPEASSINLKNSIIYACGVMKISLLYALHRTSIRRYPLITRSRHHES